MQFRLVSQENSSRGDKNTGFDVIVWKLTCLWKSRYFELNVTSGLTILRNAYIHTEHQITHGPALYAMVTHI